MAERPAGDTHLGGEEKPLLNALRWISAAVVCYGHAYLMVFHRSGTAEHLGFVLSSLASLRHVAVAAFFVISGYLVGGAVLLRAGNFDAGRYLIDRTARIYTPLVPALLLTLALDAVAASIDPHLPPYAQPWATGVLGAGVPFQNYGVLNVLASIFSVESVVAQPMGSDGALWSLGYEWTFYFLLPVVMALVTRLRLPLAGTVVALALVAGLWGALHSLAAACYWLIWVSGALARLASGEGRWRRMLSRSGAVVAILILPAIPLLPVWLKEIGLVVFGAGLALFFCDRDALRVSLLPRLDRALAGFSYSLYIVHSPVQLFLGFLFLRAGTMRSEGLPLSPAGLVPFLVLIAVSGAVAWLFGFAFEQRTPAVKAFLQRRFLPAAR